MIDSVLKGTGNSRFLKSAVPAGTSWADALAMLQAGTFPIDFNGINAEGFQQVGTPLNKANLLKDATAAQIGLPPSTTPDGMFQALGNTGELHVWRKTVVTTEPVPAGYKLGDVLTHGSSYIACQINDSSYVAFVIQEATSITVNDNGTIEASWGSNISVAYGDSYTFTPNRFVKIASINANAINSNFAAGDVVWVPSDGKIHGTYAQQNDGSYLYYLEFTKCQKVNPYPLTPAGTTTTYPVSTNPNAYQEGDDAKEAGYVVGEVVTGSFQMAEGYPSNTVFYETANSISVGADGAITLNSPVLVAFSSSGFPSAASLLGKFIRFSYRGASGSTTPPATTPPFNTTPSEVVYIPASATITHTNGIHAVDRYQPVTGYAAIPAGTTIEYLGKLGDKARMQVVSYVGTGTYGKDNKNQLTFSRKPRFIMVPGDAFGYAYIPKGMFYYVIAGNYATLEDLYCVWDDDTNTMTWYHPSFPYRQYNQSGTKYTFVAIY